MGEVFTLCFFNLHFMSNFFLDHYLKHSLRREITELYASVAIKNFAFSMVTIFEPVYLYKLYNSVSIVFLYYAIVYVIYLFVIPLGAKAAAKYGFEHCIFYSIPFAILYFLSLSQLPIHDWLIFFAIIFVIIYKVLFWPSYHADFAHYSVAGYKGREMSVMSLISTIATIVGPLAGGLILTKFGFEVLFVIVSFISLISVVPLFTTREKFKPHDFSYRKAFNRLIKPYGNYKRNDSIAYTGYGEELIAAIAWPIFIFLVLEKFYLIGILTSIMVLSVSFVSLYVGKLSDMLNRESNRKLLARSTFLRAVSWFLRPFAGNWLGVLLVDIISSGSKTGINYPLLTYIYDSGGNHRGFLKYVTFFEMSLTIGKMSIAWIMFFISLYLTGFSLWFVVFGLSGLWSLLFLFKFSKL